MFSVKLCAIYFGVTWGVIILVFGLVARIKKWENLVNLISNGYIGFDTTIKGCIAGFLWGILDGAITGALFAQIYNYFS